MNLSTLYIKWSFLGVGLDISHDISYDLSLPLLI